MSSKFLAISNLWNHRSLIWIFAVTDLKVKYRNSFLGFFWNFLEPLLMLSVLYVAFTTIIQNSIPNYPLYLLLGLVIWGMFSRGTSLGSNAILNKAGLISRAKFPREIPVISANITSFLMFIFELVAFTVFVVIFQFVPSHTILLFPIVIFILFLYSLGISFALSVLTVYVRDLRVIWEVFLRATFFLSPVIFTMDIFPENLRPIISINPMVGILNISHDLVLFETIPPLSQFLESFGVALLVFAVGYFIFKKFSNRIVEEL